MTLNSSRSSIIDARREQVARLRLRGLSMRAIASEVGSDAGTVCRDIATLRREWRENALRSTTELKSQQLAEIAEVKRVAWEGDDPDLVLKGIKLETDICGTNAPTEQVITINELNTFASQIVEIINDEVSDEVTRQRIAERIMAIKGRG